MTESHQTGSKPVQSHGRGHRGSDWDHQQRKSSNGVQDQPLGSRRCDSLQRKDLYDEQVGESQTDREDPGGVRYGEVREPQSTSCCQRPLQVRLIQAQISEGQRQTDPEWQLNPDQQTSFEGVTVISDVELRDDPPQVLLELEPALSLRPASLSCSD